MLPGVFQPTVFTRRINVRTSTFIRPMHPKTEIRPTPDAIRKVLEAGWIGQLKIHGHRAQIHIPANSDLETLAYNRQGQIHKKELSPELLSELRRIFAPSSQWTILDAEWIKSENKLYVFDLLKQNGESLHRFNFLERWKLIPRAYISPSIQTLGILKTFQSCLEALQRQESYIEGLIFKSASSGFEDSSILRCRK